jgi:thymidine phosphorylase
VIAELTDMDQPLGQAVGNALEVVEARATVVGEGPPDFTELVLSSCAHLLALSDLGVDETEGRKRAETAIADGSALEAYERWVRAQGGDPDPAVLPKAPLIREVFAPRGGYVRRVAALPIGVASVHLGGGRRTKDDVIDPSVGIMVRKKRGDAVQEGEPLAEIHARDEASADEAARDVLAAYSIADDAPPVTPIVLETVA